MTDPQEDYIELSDEEFSKLGAPSVVAQEDSEEHEEAPSESEDSSQEAVESKETLEIDSTTENSESGEKDVSDSGLSSADTSDIGGTEKENKEPEKKPAERETTNVSLVDYKAEYEKLMAPFRANGVDMQAHSVEDAIQLMQMGAGFHKKMAALKPAMRHVKLLEKHGLLDDDKLNYLIDLNNKSPEAIQKLLKDSNIDPLDIDVKQNTTYKPTVRKVTDTELVLDDVLNDIRSTPTFQRTLNVISNEWDESSQNTIASEPHIISIINGHIADGTFDAVAKRVEYERSLGRLTGVSDFEAYKFIGNAMANEGILQRVGVSQQQASTSAQIVQPSEAKPSQKEIERKQKKRAASPVKSARTSAEPTFNPLEMSDEDFAKLDINKYIKS